MAPHIDRTIEGLHEELLFVNQNLSFGLLELTENLQFAIGCLLLRHVLPLLNAVCNVAEVEAIDCVAYEAVKH